jgi:hypothetical protein
VQGQDSGHLRQVSDGEHARFKGTAKDKGVPAVVAARKKRLGKA